MTQWESKLGNLYRINMKPLELTISFLLGDLFDVEAPSAAVDGLNLSFTTLEGSSHDFDGITLANGDGSYFVLSLKFLVHVTAHFQSSDVGSSSEMSFSGFSALRRDV